jgi:hypothetical protein
MAWTGCRLSRGRRRRRLGGRSRRACRSERIRRLGAIPSYYLRYYDDTAGVVASQRDGHTRAAT